MKLSDAMEAHEELLKKQEEEDKLKAEADNKLEPTDEEI